MRLLRLYDLESRHCQSNSSVGLLRLHQHRQDRHLASHHKQLLQINTVAHRSGPDRQTRLRLQWLCRSHQLLLPGRIRCQEVIE